MAFFFLIKMLMCQKMQTKIFWYFGPFYFKGILVILIIG